LAAWSRLEGGVKVSHWFVAITALFVTALLTSNIIAVKLFFIPGVVLPWSGEPVVLPAGVIIFPVSYIFGDVLTEVYGYRMARRVIWLGFLCNLLMVLAIWTGKLLPPAPFWDAQPAYERILGFTPRLLVASFAAYLAGEFANAIVLARMKVLTQGRWLWSRTIGSTLVGQGLDSLVFVTLAFAGIMPSVEALASTILTQWLTKTVYEAAVTPVTYVIVTLLKRIEGIDVYDRETNFNPLALGE
jgi:uncharacterized integral membrane protein (TIGR00697 family)